MRFQQVVRDGANGVGSASDATSAAQGLFSHPDVDNGGTRFGASSREVGWSHGDLFREPPAFS
ncbi:hypothetical protein [Lentzea sp. NPDC003310]|uniref:hypothetical protein n=1 Tax=Lentzea sp. NPDC003310 TaxID=3154447 RepID=UPI0033ADDB34